jgi:hypothetical protein
VRDDYISLFVIVVGGDPEICNKGIAYRGFKNHK